MSWTTIDLLRERLKKRWQTANLLTSTVFPLRLPVSGPTSAEMAARFGEVRDWVQPYLRLAQAGDATVEWREIAHRQLGSNRVPQAIVFADVDQLARFVGSAAASQLRQVRQVRQVIVDRAPELVSMLDDRPRDFWAVRGDIDRLLVVYDWMRRNPNPGIYVRQLALPGVDTKFVEHHRRTLAAWLTGDWTTPRRFEQQFGFRSRPPLVRFRVLDPAMYIANFSDLSVPVAEFASWSAPQLRLIVVLENDITALALPPMPGTIAIFGRGYCFDALCAVSWLRDPRYRLIYWGDLDTHGFAILSQFRQTFASVRSILMDRQTLMTHRDRWVREERPARHDLTALTADEQAVYDDLRFNRFGEQIRLEQELIDYRLVAAALGALTGDCGGEATDGATGTSMS